MRILHVVTLVTPDGAYGGPVTVALNQLRALADLGHDVELAGGVSGYPVIPLELHGIRANLFPVQTIVPRTGFAGLSSIALLGWLRRSVRGFDLVHVHLARDLVTLPAAELAQRRGVQTFLQTHGMIDHSERISARLLDQLRTRRVLSRATAIFFLTELERAQLVEIGSPSDLLVHLINGVHRLDFQAHTSSAAPEALFLSRLHKRKRPSIFVDAAAQLADEFPHWRFGLVGPDGGEGAAVRARIAGAKGVDIRWDGALPPAKTAERCARAALFVLPSVDEPFPMAVLEAMAVGLPVVVTKSCGLADQVVKHGAGIVSDEDVTSIANAMRTLMADAQLRAECGRNARRAAREVFGMGSVAQRLIASYAVGTGQSR